MGSFTSCTCIAVCKGLVTQRCRFDQRENVALVCTDSISALILYVGGRTLKRAERQQSVGVTISHSVDVASQSFVKTLSHMLLVMNTLDQMSTVVGIHITLSRFTLILQHKVVCIVLVVSQTKLNKFTKGFKNLQKATKQMRGQ